MQKDDDNIAYVEFGSGRGQLTYWLARSSKSALELEKDVPEKFNNESVNDTKFILIDKASHRHKLDNKLKDETPDFDVTRIRVDIQDLVLEKLPVVKDHVSSIQRLGEVKPKGTKTGFISFALKSTSFRYKTI